ncbi:MAG: radical SAM protein [Candidatus Gastranaerophilales bacterium]|nr:radical SAM protein [Candidatus Gastranaerophilales bacterium]
MSGICTSPISELKELKDIFIELTAKNCNKRCRDCYIDFPLTKNVKDFIKLDSIKKTLELTKNEKLNCIYLTGAEPMTHPDFNTVLRLCLKRTNVCIFTNATFINEKKARFLKSVEEEANNQILFKLSFAHYEESKNDEVRSRGSYRQNFYALKCLDKYNFTNIICVSNYYKENHNNIIKAFQGRLSETGIENAVIQINEWCDNTTSSEITEVSGMFDCMTSRTLTENGIFACPFLANDYRGRTGSDFSDYSKIVRLETNYCAACIRNKEKMFSVDLDW